LSQNQGSDLHVSKQKTYPAPRKSLSSPPSPFTRDYNPSWPDRNKKDWLILKIKIGENKAESFTASKGSNGLNERFHSSTKTASQAVTKKQTKLLLS
jgi:hypothetical protein